MKNTSINIGKINGMGITSGALSGILWGLDTVILGIILSEIPDLGIANVVMLAPLIGAFLHDVFSSLWMILLSITKKEFIKTLKLLKTKSGKFVCVAALFGGPVGMAGYLLAINYIGSGYTASISAIYPAVGAFFSYIFLKEKLSIKGWIGLSLSILAVIILGYTPNKDIALNFGLGFGCALVCVIGWSLESVICAYGMKDDEVSPTQALQLRQLVSAIVYGAVIVPLFGGLGLTKVIITSNLTPMIASVALIGTLSYIFYYTAIDTIGPVKATGLNISYSIWAIVFDMIFLGSTITLKLVLCSILIIVGTVMVFKN